MGGLKIGEIAERAKVNLQTVRYYEKRSLVPKPPRTNSNYRMYPEDTVRRVRFIKYAQELGFTLEEIKELLSLRAAPKTRCADVRERAEAKVLDINSKIRTLKGMRKALTKLIGECSGEGPATECPILDALNHREAES
jgi:MerR family mercuric resistance operon transcriptional regulator